MYLQKYRNESSYMGNDIGWQLNKPELETTKSLSEIMEAIGLDHETLEEELFNYDSGEIKLDNDIVFYWTKENSIGVNQILELDEGTLTEQQQIVMLESLLWGFYKAEFHNLSEKDKEYILDDMDFLNIAYFNNKPDGTRQQEYADKGAKCSFKKARKMIYVRLINSMYSLDLTE